MSTPGLSQEQVEELVRAYVARVVRRYVPFVVGVVTLALIVAFVPTVSPSEQRTALGGSGQKTSALTDGGGGSSDQPLENGPAAADTSAPGTPGVTSRPRSGGGAIGRAVSPAAGQPLKDGCPGGQRQFPWSTYAPCAVRFSGNNGGATSRGVSEKSIVASFRISNSGQSAVIEAAAQGASQSQQEYVEDFKVFVDYFNSKFELFGRKVELKVFQGQGDWLAEYQGQNLEGAQADAATARDLGAFVDMTSAISATTPPYAEALAAQKVISAGGVAASARFLERLAPYAYTAVPTLTVLGNHWAALVCQRMTGLPAAFAGDPLMRGQARAFGIVVPEVPDYKAVGDEFQRRITECGAKVARRVDYSINLATLAQQHASIAAQMKAAGATTVVCFCDNVSPTVLTRAATQQQYRPEWVATAPGDNYGQQRDPDQWAHAIVTSGSLPAPTKTEAYRVYKMARPNEEPKGGYWLPMTYYSAMLLFSSLQSAGPNLSPQTFMAGEFALPPSLPGADLPWSFGRNVFSPVLGLQIGWWNPSAPSPENGNNGTSISCKEADGEWKPAQTYTPAAYAPARTQLRCFGS
jgi:hypothetical protein